MPETTPFHPRTAELCASMAWKDWSGYHAVRRYDTLHEPEYHAVRQAAGLLDVTPLFKLDVRGPGAGDLLAWVTARDPRKLKVGRVAYCTWCDEQGRLLDDGTLTRRDDEVWRLTSADPPFAWLHRAAREFDAQVTDVTRELGALALQGPRSRAILADCCEGDVSALRFFGHTRARLAGVDVEITRTGYTGDLGYEVWVPAGDALPVWDALMEAGRPHGLRPLGLDALDMLRIEAGFVLLGVDYVSARRAFTPEQTSSPFELGLDFTVKLDREAFVGRDALAAERRDGSPWSFVGLDIDWVELEELHARRGLPPALPSEAWRASVPLFEGARSGGPPGSRPKGKQVGWASSGTWSPLLKKNLALASVRTPFAGPGTRLSIETLVDHRRRFVTATVTTTPFFDPERKTSVPGRGERATARADGGSAGS